MSEPEGYDRDRVLAEKSWREFELVRRAMPHQERDALVDITKRAFVLGYLAARDDIEKRCAKCGDPRDRYQHDPADDLFSHHFAGDTR